MRSFDLFVSIFVFALASVSLLCVVRMTRFRPERAVIAECANVSPPEKLVLPELQEIHALIRAAARKYQVPVAFVKSIVAAESNFNCTAVSRKGAVGLMQLMPGTAREYGADDPTVPEQN